MALITEETLLPCRQPWVLQQMIWKAASYREDYCLAHEALLARGVVFEDKLFDEVGGNLRLYINSAPQDAGFWTPESWAYYEDHTRLLPDHADAWSYVYSNVWNDFIEPLQEDTQEEDWEAYVVNGPAMFLNRRIRFLVGMSQRILVPLWQHRIAKGIENIFCLDNRGRPRMV